MRLSSLKIKGFKSFAEETVIHFGENVIGIVGPNGAGKSNIVDAIRWVLGEQKSKELRLEKMSNVIFNGTKDRRSGSVAEVSLSFENTKNLLPTEYQQVTISRLQYRSGESEYRLNGVTCRLKDITSLFLDTGIGSNSYAIIALGMVEDILADKNNARRNMFEQAAGISRYKIRKRQTFNKLKSTEADLERVEDLLFEIENNLKALEKQARRARRYFKIKGEYRDLSIQWAAQRLSTQKEQHKQLTTAIEKTTDALGKVNTEAIQLESAIEAERKTQLDKERSLSERQQQLNSLTDDIRRMESRRDILRQSIQYAESNIQRLEQQLAQHDSLKQELHQKKGDLQSRIETEETILQQLHDDWQQSAQILNEVSGQHAEERSSINSFNSQRQAIEQQLYETEKQRAIDQSQFENEQRSLENYEAVVKHQNELLKQAESQLKDAQKQTQQIQGDYDKLLQQNEAREQQLLDLEKQLEIYKTDLAALSRKLDAEKNNYQLTKSMIENLEGFPESIKFLSKHKSWSETAPLLSDILHCPDASYRVAVETYLEPFLNYYVVQNETEAIKAIQLLGEAQKGKANFFILDSLAELKTTAPPDKPEEATPALDVVQTDDRYQPLITHLLQRVAIVNEEKPLKHQRVGNWVIIARSGRFVQRKTRIFGGSVGLFEGMKIGRQKNLQSIENKINKLEKEHLQAQQRIDKLREQIERLQNSDHKTALQPLQQQLSEWSRQQATYEARLENARTAVSDAKEKQAAAKQKMTAFQKAIKDKSQSLSKIKKQLDSLQSQVGDTDDSFQQLSNRLAEASADYNAKNVAYIRQQNTVNQLQQEVQYIVTQQKDSGQRALENQQALQQQSSQRQAYEDEHIALEKGLLTQYDLKKTKTDDLSTAERSYFQVREQINAREEKLRQQHRQERDVQTKLATLKEQFNELKLSISSVSERMKAEFGIDEATLFQQEISDDAPDIDALTEKVEKLRHRLHNYGEINPLAVEAYDEMNERYESIHGQRQDILDAKASLEETIKEIELTATEHLMDAFEKVRVYFKDVFRSLFTENDDCDLILLEPENPLESPIEIIAKPKGKRPQSISQLSGGEKTLTATALLFALYLLKPAPFCIFDEVDAPLDDANIEKFNRIIKKFSTDSQFVIVTHNKQTMAAVDVIYGVYMQEQGVSGVSAVDFRSLKNNGEATVLVES